MYLNPNNSRPKMNVYIAPQRNHQNARSSSFGFTFGFSSLSRSGGKGTFTRLKKYSCPSHTMPNMMWANRRRTLVRDGMSSNMGALYTQSTRRSTGSGRAFTSDYRRVRRRGLSSTGAAAAVGSSVPVASAQYRL